MKLMNKRIISLLLALAILLSVMPMTAFATEETEAACGHAYENGSCTACGKKQSQQLVDGSVLCHLYSRETPDWWIPLTQYRR